MGKVYRNIHTKELFSMTVPGELCSLFDDKHIFVSNVDIARYYEEINAAPVDKIEPTRILYKEFISAYTDFNTIQDHLNSDSDLDTFFGVGDTYYIPTEGYEQPLPFEIVHIDNYNRSLYLMPKDILAMMPMTEVDDWLKDFQDKLPWDLVEYLKPIEHINSTGMHTGLVMLPSEKNMGVDKNECKGADDITFDKFRDGASRCKNFEGETKTYWTDTLSVFDSDHFAGVYASGGVSTYGNYVDFSLGVCPIIKLSEEK